MSITVPLTGFGGGAPLNFKIVGNPLPETVGKNTIHVDTDTQITGWVFSPTEPAGQAGFLWIRTGAGGPVSVDALKRGGILLYPLSVMQYSSDCWVRKDARIFTGELWQSLSNQLKLSADSWAVLPNAAYGHTFTEENGTLTFAASQGHVNQWQSAGRYYREKLDLTPYSTMTVDLIFTHSGGGNIKFGLTRDLNVSDLGSAPAVVARDASFTGQLQLDISALTGEYYAAMNLYIGGDTAMGAVIRSITFS